MREIENETGSSKRTCFVHHSAWRPFFRTPIQVAFQPQPVSGANRNTLTKQIKTRYTHPLKRFKEVSFCSLKTPYFR
jgi:hypothetical protein